MKLSGAHLNWRYLFKRTGLLASDVPTSLLGVRCSELLGDAGFGLMLIALFNEARLTVYAFQLYQRTA
jgi:hypothetical protein